MKLLCTRDGPDLVAGREYERIPDSTLDSREVRVVDESGEDFIHSAELFKPEGGDPPYSSKVVDS